MIGDQDELIERRGRTAELIKHMLKERNQLLSLMLQISEDSSSDTLEYDLDLLLEFRQVLVDYIAAGHFGLYGRIIEGKERRQAVADKAVNVFPRIEKTAEVALAFDEKYNPENGEIDLSSFQLDFSHLGEELTTRIELEDQLITALQKKRSNQVR
jgi:regulator of sigma D